MMHLKLHTLNSPLGAVLLVSDPDERLRALDYADFEQRMQRLLRQHYGDYRLEPGDTPPCIRDALEDYFHGNLGALEAIPAATAGTPFQRAVWQQLRTIAPGTTRTYGQIAAQLGSPRASRAVGAANGANPIAIVVPCHRVIGANGALTGYAGSLARKQWLLKHERCYTCQPELQLAAASS